MLYGICLLSVIPVRSRPDEQSDLLTQLLYGEDFKVREQRKNWSRVTISQDTNEGWVQNHQIQMIEETVFNKLGNSQTKKICTDLVAHTSQESGLLTPIVLGSRVDICPYFKQQFEGNAPAIVPSKEGLVDTALSYLNAPYLMGGKTPFGIDSSGFTHMLYKINGFELHRDTEKQSALGEPLSFIEESEAGDLAFFDNKEGIIDHVGLILKDNYIIHAHGKVRIDRIDHTGIFNAEKKLYSHQLRVIKKVI